MVPLPAVSDVPWFSPFTLGCSDGCDGIHGVEDWSIGASPSGFSSIQTVKEQFVGRGPRVEPQKASFCMAPRNCSARSARETVLVGSSKGVVVSEGGTTGKLERSKTKRSRGWQSGE